MTGRAAHPLRKASSIKTRQATRITFFSFATLEACNPPPRRQAGKANGTPSGSRSLAAGALTQTGRRRGLPAPPVGRASPLLRGADQSPTAQAEGVGPGAGVVRPRGATIFRCAPNPREPAYCGRDGALSLTDPACDWNPLFFLAAHVTPTAPGVARKRAKLAADACGTEAWLRKRPRQP
jgi:hypothetical protein